MMLLVTLLVWVHVTFGDLCYSTIFVVCYRSRDWSNRISWYPINNSDYLLFVTGHLIGLLESLGTLSITAIELKQLIGLLRLDEEDNQVLLVTVFGDRAGG